MIASTTVFLSTVVPKIPPELMRTFDGDYLYGYIGTGNEPDSFLIIQTYSRDLATARLFDWEKTMLNDLITLFPITNLMTRVETEKIISLGSTRVFMNGFHVDLVYGLLDNRTLLIASSKEAFDNISGRYSR